MKFYRLISVLVVSFWIFAFGSQAVMAGESPSMNTCSPMTYPVSYFRVTGSIKTTLGRYLLPLANVRLSVVNTSNREELIAFTNRSGDYCFVARNGSYSITPQKSLYLFSPKSILLRVSRDLSGINFSASSLFLDR